MATESEIALGAAQTATTKAAEASASASSASTSASTATTKASEASTSATSASTSATTASQKATEIANLVASITTAQGICETKADNSATSAEEASQSAALAGSRATSAGTYATSASQSATVATTKASEAAASAASAIQNFNTLDAAKVDKVAGKALSTNDFNNAYKGQLDNLSTDLGNKVDKITGKGLSANDYTTAEKTKLSGIATGATANDTDVNLKSRANHTGTQTASTISDFVATVLASVLTGLSTVTNATITATDTVLGALGKLQKQITDHLANTSNPHSVTKAQVGLGSVQNTDTTNPANITQSATYRFVSDIEKTTWNAKESAITAGTTAQYYRGDKTFQTLNKSAVGLGNIDNTSDALKPVSTAQQTALDTKAPIANPIFTGDIETNGTNGTFSTKNVQSNLYLLRLTRASVSMTTAGSVGFGTETPSGILDVVSITLPSYPFPRMTTTQVNALTGMVAGAMVFDTTTGHPKYYSGSAWVQL